MNTIPHDETECPANTKKLPGEFHLSTIQNEPIICQNPIMLENEKSPFLDIKCRQIYRAELVAVMNVTNKV